MSPTVRRNRWLVAAALPLSVGTFQSRSARAQSVPPLRQSLPPRCPSLPPPGRSRRLASAASHNASLSDVTADPCAADVPSTPSEPAASPPVRIVDTTTGAVEPQSDPVPRYWDGAYLTTDWGGSRSWLLERGVDVQLQYTSEGFTRIHGGTGSRRPHAYLGSIIASVDLDTGAMGAWPGGSFHAHMQSLHGNGISEDHVGSIQSMSNLEAEPFTTLAEYWYRQELFDGVLALKVGKQEGNVDFAASEYAGNLLDSSFGVFPTLSLSTYPNWGLGAAVFVSPADWLTIQSAVFDGAPDGREPFGGTTAFRGDGGHLFVSEVQVHVAPLLGSLPGTVRLGGWLHTGHTDALPTSADESAVRTFAHNDGLYGIVDQKLYQPRGDGREGEGLGVFAQAGLAPEDRNEARLYLGGGLAYTGPIPSRPADVVAAGVGHVNLASAVRNLEGRTSETVLELSYKAQLAGFFSVQPDVQYVVRPGGAAGVPDASVVGIRMIADL